MSERYVKLYEKISTDKFLMKNRELGFVFVILVTKAQYKDYQTDKGIIKRGQWLTTMNYIADQFEVDQRTVSRWLNKLQKANYLNVKHIKGYSACTLITIRNYNRYQDTNVGSDGSSVGSSVGSSHGSSHGHTYKKDIEGNRKHYNDIEPDVVNSTDYFGDDVVVVPTVRNELRNRDLWDKLSEKWVTTEYANGVEKIYNQYWCQLSEQYQQEILSYVQKCSDSILHKIWKRDIFATKDPLLSLQAKVALNKPKSDNKYRNEGSKPPNFPVVKVDFSHILNPDGTPKKPIQ